MADEIKAAFEKLDRYETALHKLDQPVPRMKGMDPKSRVARLRAEMERRNKIARDALHPPDVDEVSDD